MLPPDFYQTHYYNAIGFEQYLEDFKTALEFGSESKYGVYIQYLPLNWQRTTRVYQQYQPSHEILAAAAQMVNKVHWLIIVEPWCGDVSQSLPVMARIAESSNGRIDLRLVYRDQKPDLMDAHLTNGTSRSIPILIQLDEQFRVMGTWGPRPAEAQALVSKLKSDPTTADNYAEELHRWYARNKQEAIQSELITLLQKA